MPVSDDLTLLIDAARASAEIALRFFREDPETWDKGGNQGPVTEADLAIDTMLKAELRAARPDYGWLSEETEDSGDRLDRERVFIVDPIDGTRAFIAGEKTWSHSLAIAEGGVITKAVVLAPVIDRLYSAETGAVSTLNGEAITATARPEMDGATVLAAKSNMEERHWHGGVPPVTRHFRPSLAYRLSLVAQGRFDAMLTLRPCWEWDIAAGALIVQQAGGAATEISGAPLRFNSPTAQTSGCLAAGPDLHAALLPRLRAL